jgi:hypothetical protein
MRHQLPLVTAPVHLGCIHWWGCPLVSNGAACYRRYEKLSLPASGLSLGCRQGYGLPHRSSQESHTCDTLVKSTGCLVARQYQAHTP